MDKQKKRSRAARLLYTKPFVDSPYLLNLICFNYSPVAAKTDISGRGCRFLFRMLPTPLSAKRLYSHVHVREKWVKAVA